MAVRFELPAGGDYPTRAAWDATAAALVATMLERWSLRAGEAFTGGEAGAALAVTQADGSPAVLKVGFPHHEAVAEALGLEAWAPEFAPRVLRQDAWTWSLLLERVHPGTPLSRADLPVAEALAVAGPLLARLHVVPAPAGVPSIREVVGVWLENARDLTGSQDAPSPVIASVRARLADAAELLRTDRGRALLHGDANPGNILLDENGTWRAIDPKPMTGDPEFDLAPTVEQIGDPWAHAVPEEALESGLRVLNEAVSGDWSRSLRWGAARAALDVVWAWEDGDAPSARAAIARLETWERLSGS